MKRKLLSLLLALTMTVSLLTVGASAVEPTYGDIAGHWAEASIERWSGHGIIQGNNGKFNPNGQLTCAHFAAILARLLKLPAATDAGFADNNAQDWFFDAINRCAAAGILKGNLNGTVTPNAPITRERAMVMLGRALGIEPIENPDLTKYADAAQVAPYAQGMLAALIEAGVVGGVTADQLAPQNNITRAATVTILDRAIGTYADKAGETVNADGKGIVLVVADDVTVTGSVNKLLVPTDDIEVTVKGSKNIDDITVSGNNSTVILNNASADNVTLDGEKSAVEAKNGAKIDNVIMSENASGATVDVGSGTTVGNVENHAEDTTVTGSGTVKKVESDSDITVQTKETDVKNSGDSKITVTDKSGKDTTIGTTGSGSSTTVKKGTTSSGGGGGGGSSSGSSHSHSYADAWSHDATHHWHASTCGHDVVSGKAEHTWNGGEVTTAATCGAAGEKTFTCTVCGATKTEVIPATGEHTPVEVPAQAATCTEAGHTAGTKCSVCDTIISGMEEIPALGHTWGAYVITHAVSGRDGTKTRTCSVCNATENETIPYKFYLGVTSGSTVDMTVGGDYTATITLPKAGETVNAGSVDLTAKMKDVASLGVEGEKSHTTTISTGLGEMNVDLSEKLTKCYGFEGAAINATVDGTSCTYNIGAINKDGELYTIEAAPADIDAARATWQELTKHVTTSTQGSDDSKIVIKNGAYLKIGTEMLEFESDEVGDLELNNLSDMAALNTTIREHIKLTDCTNQGGTITMYLPAGTQLAVGGSVATLEKSCTVTITLDEEEMGSLSTALSTLQSKTDATTMVKELVTQFDNLVGVIDATGTVDVNVSFT
ncbi:S-layer homology domain-containing protein [Dysosmobacter sp.]|uniref:S-layer homology domain-containing protein n=1 Tax=Dysosmobacter sp. TaxID=2591382 RepID=UPI003AB39CC2